MLKKISSLLLAFTIVFSIGTAFAVQVDWTDDERIAMLLGETLQTKTEEKLDIIQQLLYQLGIISDPSVMKMDAKLSTADFLKAIAEISGAASGNTESEVLFNQLKKAGYINLNSSKANVTIDNALFSAVILLNRSYEAEARGGYPGGYYTAASRANLLNNLVYSGSAKITNAEALQLFYNILSAEKRVLDNVGDKGASYSSTDVTTILEEKYHITLQKGILTAANLTSIYGPSSLSEREIEIDRVIYDYTGDLSELCVGSGVAAFVRRESGENRGTVLCLEAYRTTITAFRYSDVEEYDNKRITLENDEKVYYSNPRVIYNGVYSGMLEDKLPSYFAMNAHITAIDNNNDGRVEVLNVVGYEHFVTEFDVGSSGAVAFKHGATFNGERSITLLSDADCYVEITKNGKLIQPEEITSNTVISMAMSANKIGKKYLKVKVCDEQISGVVAEVVNDGTTQKLTVDGEQYCYLVNRTDIEPKVGKSYVFLLSEFGDIVDMTESNTSLKWGFLVKYDAERGLSDAGKLKVFTQDGKMLLLDIADRARYFDEVNINGVKLTGKEIVEKLAAGSISRVPVRYMVNAEDKISELYVPIDNTDNHMEPESYPCLYSKNMVKGRFYNMKFLTSGGSYFMEMNALVFAVPEAENDRDELYRVTTLEKEGGNEVYTVQLYNASSLGVCPVAVLESGAQSMDDHKMARIIEKVAKGVNSAGEDVLKIYTHNANGIVDAGEAARTVIEVDNPDMLSYDNDRGWIKNVKAKDLKFGDVIGCDLDSTGRMERFKVYFRADDPGQLRVQDVNGSRVTDGSENIESIGTYFAYATIESCSTTKNATYVKYNVGTESAPIYYVNQIQSIYGTGAMYHVNTQNNKITKMTISDFKPGDKVILYRSWGGINMMALVD